MRWNASCIFKSTSSPNIFFFYFFLVRFNFYLFGPIFFFPGQNYIIFIRWIGIFRFIHPEILSHSDLVSSSLKSTSQIIGFPSRAKRILKSQKNNLIWIERYFSEFYFSKTLEEMRNKWISVGYRTRNTSVSILND